METLRNPASDVAKQDLFTIFNTDQMPRLQGKVVTKWPPLCDSGQILGLTNNIIL